MSGWPQSLATLRARVRRRRLAAWLLRWLPWLLLLCCVMLRAGGAWPASVVFGLALAAGLAVLVRDLRAVDRDWIVRALDRSDRQLQDSSDLLFAPAADLNPLQRLQQARVGRRLQRSLPELRAPLPWLRLMPGLLLVPAGITALWLWPAQPIPLEPPHVQAPADAAPAVHEQHLQAWLDSIAPAYTGLPPRRLDALEGEVVQDSELTWHLGFAIAPRAARLRFVDGQILELHADGERWTGTRRLAASTLYRIELEGAPPLPERTPYRIDVIPDLAPRVTVLEPERTLTVLDAATPRWSLAFEASDDHGLGAAHLELTLAQGSGEQVSVSKRRIALRGEGDARSRRYLHRVDLATLGFAQGDDLIARLDVRDLREPEANITRSASFILRWPAPQGFGGSGVEGLVQQAMPAYFRSQRQIIIDTEALIAAWPTLDEATALSRSDTIGVDQRILRLRYGQFLGEEAETDAPPPPEGPDDVHEDDHDSDHPHAPAAAPPTRGGDARDLMAAAGHLHDLPEAATLLDPDTRKLLRAALDQMWQAERELRSGRPIAALPYEQRALEFIKRVQQADRIYLARVGLELPQLDASRRLTGERPRPASRNDPLSGRDAADVPVQVWNALRDAEAPAAPFDAAVLGPLAAWLRDAPTAIDDPLALLAQVDALQRDPACAACRKRLALQLWPVLSPPAAPPRLRERADDLGAAYLDALPTVRVTP